jgi:hypothetical protein
MICFDNDPVTLLRNFAHRMGVFPNGARVLLGHLGAFNMMTIIFGAGLTMIVNLAARLSAF